jgi:hypothetical protein
MREEIFAEQGAPATAAAPAAVTANVRDKRINMTKKSGRQQVVRIVKDVEKDLNRTFTREEHEKLRLEIIRQARTLDEVDDIVRVFALGPPRRR